MVFHEKKNESVLLKSITKVLFLETIIMSLGMALSDVIIYLLIICHPK